HDVLRTIVLPDGRQQILERVPTYEMPFVDLRGLDPATAAARLAALRGEMSTRVHEPHLWPLFDIRATWMNDGRLRIHFSIDLLIVGAAGMMALFAEWSEASREPGLRVELPELSFRDYVLAELAGRESAEHAEAERYWRERLATLASAPDLPLA